MNVPLWEIIGGYVLACIGLLILLFISLLWSWSLERRVKTKTREIQKMNESMFLYGELLKFSGDGIYRYTYDEGKILLANDGLVKILDFKGTSEELEGKYLKDVLIYTEEPGSVRRAANAQGEIHNYEYHFKTLKGEDRWVIHNSLITRDERTGKKCIDAVVKDITERKNSEKRLLDSEKTYREIFNANNDMFLIQDINDGRIIDFSKSTEELTGASREELIERGVSGFTPNDGIHTMDKIVEHLQRAKQGNVEAFEWAFVDKAGIVHPTETTLKLATINGVPRLLATVRDISERKKNEAEIEKYKNHLQELVVERTNQLEMANKELEAFAYSVSHDLQVPLRAINGFVQILSEEEVERLDDEGKRLLKIIKDNASKMGELINDLLTLSRSTRVAMKTAVTDLTGMFNEIVADLKDQLAERKVKFNLGEIPPVSVDPTLFKQAMTNLLINALKFTRTKPEANCFLY